MNFGDRPAGCRILEDSYVDDILTFHNDLEQLDKTTKAVEELLKAGGFKNHKQAPEEEFHGIANPSTGKEEPKP